MKRRKTIRVGVTIGDHAGIGPEVTAKALYALRGEAAFRIIADPDFISRYCPRLGRIPGSAVCAVPGSALRDFSFGTATASTGRAALAYLQKAVALFNSGEIDCLVTAPVSKEAIAANDPRFRGQTEFLATALKARTAVMMLLNERLRCILLTRHLPLARVAGSIRAASLLQEVLCARRGLRAFFSLRDPSFVVCGVNPHASDNGLLGEEEARFLAPAVRRLRARGVRIVGPLAADDALRRAAAGKFDCAVAAYHDQALIALKLTAPETGVNLTLGLPLVRTSPLHGTALDIAGTDRADPRSMIAAVRLALACASNRKKV